MSKSVIRVHTSLRGLRALIEAANALGIDDVEELDLSLVEHERTGEQMLKLEYED